MPNLYTPPPKKHSLRSKKVRIFHLTGIQPLALRSFGRAAAHCLKALSVRSTVPNPIPFPSERLAERQSPNEPEPFVTPVEAAAFLRCAPVTIKRLAREGKIPAHSIHNGIRKRWRFLISELAISMKKEVSSDRSSTPLSPQKGREKAV